MKKDKSQIRFVQVDAVDRLFKLRQGPNPISLRCFGVGVALATFMNDKGQCYPSRKAIAERFGISSRAVTEEIGKLEKAGFMSVSRASGKVSKYSLTPDQSDRGVKTITTTSDSPDTPALNDPDTPDQSDTRKEPRKKSGKKRSATKTNGEAKSRDNPVNRIQDYFVEAYKAKFGGEPSLNYARAGKAIKGWLDKGHTEEIITKAIDAFFTDDDDWLRTKAGWTWGTFQSRFDKYAQQAATAKTVPQYERPPVSDPDDDAKALATLKASQ
jgi:hypothetical protein